MSFLKSPDDLIPASNYKRFLEYAGMDKGFLKRYEEDPVGELKRSGIKLRPEEILHGDYENELSDAAVAYRDFFNAKLDMRDRIKVICDPIDERFAKWRNRQMERCARSFSQARTEALVHITMAWELSSGCSVGCKFCGLNSGKLSKVFFASDENKELWKGCLDAATKIIGPSVGQGMCYYGTEPLDNPDYEYFMEDWYERFGRYAQITTAAATRNIERTRHLLSKLDINGDTIFRFSIKSLEEFNEIMAAFTPEELILTELLPQFEEAPQNHFVKSGRNAGDGEFDETICCTSGFLVNMCDQTIKLITPINASERFPNGQVEYAVEHFNDAKEFEEKMQKMIDGMKTILSPTEELKMYDYLDFAEDKDGGMLIANKLGYGIKFGDESISRFVKRACEMLKEGGHNRRGIGEAMCEIDSRFDPVSIYSIINKMWNMGIIVDNQLFD